MKLKHPRSTHHPHPRRMPARTHWREELGDLDELEDDEPAEDVSAHLWVERTVPQAVTEVEQPRPPVTNAAWVDWVEQRMREARTAADKSAPQLPDIRAPWATSAAPATVAVPAPTPAPAPAPAPARERPSLEQVAQRRHRIVMTVFVAVAVALVGVLAVGSWWWVGQLDGEPSERVRSVASGDASANGVPAPPVPLPADGEHTLIRVHDSGDLEVQQWVRRPQGITHLALAAPEGVQVSDLYVARGSRQVQVSPELLTATEVSLPPRTTLYLHYWLSGALERSGTRALARATSVVLLDDAPVGSQTIDFEGATLLSLACLPASGSDEAVPCGSEAGAKGWQVISPVQMGADVQVIAQIDIHPTG